MPDLVHAYLFEAKGIQRYLFLGGKLRDVVGASDLVSGIATSNGEDWIGAVLADSNCESVEGFSRRAGGAFCLHGPRETLVAVRRAFRMKVMRALPGLEFSDALGAGADALAAAAQARTRSGGSRANSAASVLPLGRPVFAIVPRTGLPMVGQTAYDDPLDRILAPQRTHADDLAHRAEQLDGVAARFHPEGRPGIRYPRNLEDDGDEEPGNPQMPWRDAHDRRVGLVHADLSGLGQLYAGAGCTTAEDGLALAGAIEAALVKAAQGANADILLPHARPHSSGAFEVAPARPLVLGGDDVTLLVRADLALPFATRLLALIEQETQELRTRFPHLKLPAALTACAGVAIARAGHPFLTMYALAESLCSHAKKAAKKDALPGQPYASLLAFHVQTQTAEEDYARDILPGQRAFTGNPYRIGEHGAHLTALARWDDLTALAGAVAEVTGSANSLRRIKALLGNGRRAEANTIWHRLFTRTDRPAKGLLDQIRAIAGADVTVHAVPACGALFDALELIDLGVFNAPLPLEQAAA